MASTLSTGVILPSNTDTEEAVSINLESPRYGYPVQVASWILVGAVLILWGLRFGVAMQLNPWFSVADAVSIASGLTVIVGAPYLTRKGWDGVLPWVIVGVVVAAFCVWSYQEILLSPSYATDELAFDQYAAHLFLHGIDPYRVSLGAAFQRYQVSPDAYTLTFQGHPVTMLSYPSLSFLLYVPLMFFGFHAQAGEIMDISAWAVSIVLSVVYVKESWRTLVLVLGSLSAYIAYAVGGVTDALFLPFLICSIAYMSRFVEGRRWGFISPVMLGVAMAVKQTPWLVAPFLAVVVIRWSTDFAGPAKARARLVRFVALAGLGFGIWQLPFIVVDFHSWILGIMTPLRGSIVPSGQGLVALTLSFGVGGGGVEWLTVMSVLAMVGGLVFLWFDWKSSAWMSFMLPSIALFFATRSFGSYFVSLIPTTMVALSQWPRYRAVRRSAVVVPVVAVSSGLILVSLGVWALSTPPEQLKIVGIHTSGQLATVDSVTLQVANTGSKAITPVYTSEFLGSFTSPWTLLSGPRTIAPGSTGYVKLGSPNFPAQPSLLGGFQMAAFSGHSISVTTVYKPELLHVALVPDAVDQSIKVNSPIVIRAELLNRFDQRIKEAGVPIYLGQVIYAQRGLVYSSASINKSSPGATPVEELTNASGVAIFRVVDSFAESNPVSFEANLVSSSGFYPYGYSQIVPIRFVHR